MSLAEERACLVLEDHSVFAGKVFGSSSFVSGEVVFNTGMVGYPESMTDPSYYGQILVMTYPLVGNYGVPKKEIEEDIIKNFESGRIQVKGLIIGDYSNEHSHWNANSSLDDWMKQEGIPGIYGIDTRELTKKLRTKGTMLGAITSNSASKIRFEDPNRENLVKAVSLMEPVIYGRGSKDIVLLDCGCKESIIRCLVQRGFKVTRVPWDFDFNKIHYDGLFVSNGPGNPKMAGAAIENIKLAIEREKPIFGICLGNQLLALAAGGNTYKLKFGHRGQNQPCIQVGTKRCYITSQNHGFAVDAKRLPTGWQELFVNANDQTNEGIFHRSKPFFSVQFHPEAMPGPVDTGFLFDHFSRLIDNEEGLL